QSATQVYYEEKIIYSEEMTVVTSTHLTIDNKASDSNKYSLKVSLVGIPQRTLTEIKDTENFIIKTLISDYYVGQPVDYMTKVIFSHTNPQLEHLKITIYSQESLIFVIRQMEIIDKEFYIYTNDISYINTKKNELNINNNETLLLDNPI
ncbi:6809_t:CDS:2, partial [Scutellospora calospora]